MNLEKFEQKYTFVRKVGEGFEGVIYRISDNEVAKLVRAPFLSRFPFIKGPGVIDRLLKKYKIQKDLYNERIKVAKPQGVFDVPFRRNPLDYMIGLNYLAIVMKFLNGIGLSKISFQEPIRKWKTQINKARKLGYHPEDTNSNAIWVPDEKETYLIDFTGWKRK